jgi:hypothetical protein
MLFQAYIGGRPAEFVHSSKDKASEGPLGEREAASKNAYPWKVVYYNYNDNSNNNSDSNANDEPECNNDSDAGNDLGSDNNVLFDSKDNASNDGAANKDIDRHSYANSGYNSNGIDVTMIEDIDKCYMTELNACG